MAEVRQSNVITWCVGHVDDVRGDLCALTNYSSSYFEKALPVGRSAFIVS